MLENEEPLDTKDTDIDYTNEEIAANINEDGINAENNQEVTDEPNNRK